MIFDDGWYKVNIEPGPFRVVVVDGNAVIVFMEPGNEAD